MTDLSKSQLNTILSALDGKQRNPNTKDAALKAIARHGERLGLSTDDILAAAGGLLDGRIPADEWYQMLERYGDEDVQIRLKAHDSLRRRGLIEAPAEPTVETGEPAEDDAAPFGAEPVEDAPVAATAAPAAEPDEEYVMPNAGPLAPSPKTRADTKQARMIAMLKRPEGATIAQIAEATGWQKHYADAGIMPR